MDILRILEDLDSQINRKPKHFLGLTFGLDRDEVSMLIAKLRASLPSELKQAATTLRESERIVDSAREDANLTLENTRKESERIVLDARAEAERIIEEARLVQQRMVADSEILKLAKAQGDEIRSSADRDAVRMRRGAEEYAYDTLTKIEEVMGRVMTSVERGKQEIQRETPSQAVVRDRERTRVS